MTGPFGRQDFQCSTASGFWAHRVYELYPENRNARLVQSSRAWTHSSLCR